MHPDYIKYLQQVTQQVTQSYHQSIAELDRSNRPIDLAYELTAKLRRMRYDACVQMDWRTGVALCKVLTNCSKQSFIRVPSADGLEILWLEDLYV